MGESRTDHARTDPLEGWIRHPNPGVFVREAELPDTDINMTSHYCPNVDPDHERAVEEDGRVWFHVETPAFGDIETSYCPLCGEELGESHQ